MNSETLNRTAAELANTMVDSAETLRLYVAESANGGRILDCGVNAVGGVQAGLMLSRVCMSGLADIRVTRGTIASRCVPHIEVVTDHPTASCLLSQYAGWQVTGERYFGMGSGPMRLAACREPMLREFGFEPTPVAHAVGVLEAGKLPSESVVAELVEKCGGGELTLLVAPTASQAGNIQILARSVETAMHKLHEVGFDPHQVISGFGSAPLPPVAADDLTGIGRTNDAILYGARVTLWVDCDDDQIREIGPQVPSNSSAAHGRAFLDLFKEANGDFYAIDKHLFSPAMITFSSLQIGRAHV